MNSNLIDQQKLLEAGYKQSKSPTTGYGDQLFQKRVRQGSATLYFIDFCEYDFTPYRDRLPPGTPGLTYEPRAQFTTGNADTFNVAMLLKPGDRLEDVERFFEKIFWAMGCRPYDGEIHPLISLAAQGKTL